MKTRGEAYDEAWCVLDVEHGGQAAKLTEATALAVRHGIHLCLSNPCFEVWLIAHFESMARLFSDCSAAEQYLKQKHWKTVSGTAYDKADPDIYRKTADRLPEAIANARTVLEQHHGGECRECNFPTEVFKLVQKLLPPG